MLVLGQLAMQMGKNRIEFPTSHYTQEQLQVEGLHSNEFKKLNPFPFSKSTRTSEMKIISLIS